MPRPSSDRSSTSSAGSPSLSLSSFPLTPSSSQATEPPSPKRRASGFVFCPTSSLPAHPVTDFASLSAFASSSPPASKRLSPRPSFESDPPEPHSFNFSATRAPSSPKAKKTISHYSEYSRAPESSFMLATVVDAAEEETCPICLELLSLKLAGEKADVVPVCGHRLHHSCFEAVYGDVARAKTKTSGSLGLCGVCRRDMKIGDGSDAPGKRNKFAKLSGLPAPATEGPAVIKLRSRSRGTLDVDPEQEDDEIVSSFRSLSTGISSSTLSRQSYGSGSSSTTTMSNRRGSADTSNGTGNPQLDLVKPIITVRSEHPSVERTTDGDRKQYLTCMVSIEIPSRWPFSPPMPELSPFDDSQSTSLPPPSSSLLARSPSSIRSAPRSASPTPSSVYSGYACGPTSPASPSKFAQVFDDLHKRMADWKGHSPYEFGQLRLYDRINVRKDAASREFLVYLFEEAILCVADDKRKVNDKPADSFNGMSDRLRLKGRVYVRHIRNVVDSSKDGDLSLTIAMSDDAVAEFVMLFQERNSLELWKAQIESLLRGNDRPSPPSVVNTRKLSTPGDSSSDSSSGPSFVPSTSDHTGLSGYSRTTNSTSLAPLSESIQEDHCDHFGRFVQQHQQSQPGYASSSLVTSPSSRSIPLPPTPVHANAPRQFTSLDLMLILSVPSSGPTSLKIGILRNSLEFVTAHVGPRTRISLVLYTAGEGPRGVLRKTPFLAVGKPESKARLEQAIAEIGNEGGASASMVNHHEERVNVVTACNVALDIVLQRKAKSALTGMVLLNDGRDGAQKQQMDLVMARAEAANVPIHTLGYGKSHDPSSLWLLSNHTGGSYTFVKDFYDLRDALAGCVGGILSVAATNLRLHINVPEKRWFKIRKVSGTPGAIVSSSGTDVDIEIGELGFGQRKDLIVEVEMSLAGYGDNHNQRSGQSESQGFSATDAFFLAKAGINPSTLDDYNPTNLYDDEYDSMPDEVPLFEVNAAYRDPAAAKSVSRLNQTPCLLTVTVNPPSSNHRTLPQAPPSAPEIVKRRMELLVSDMLSRALLLMTRRNDAQAGRLLEETKRIIMTISRSLVVPQVHRRPSAVAGIDCGRKSTSHVAATAQAHRTLSALAQDVDAVHEACLDRGLFEINARYQAAQQAVVLRDQRAFTSKSLTEKLYWTADHSLWMASQSQQWVSATL
ncbi:VWA and PH domain-containing RING finger protein [Sporobolomyces koalae]|uniref:VWA and PH domain-containing RING finger protein n=1 Tax=Sporobolomyces koalae TaxID=500713 RepID=UPI00317A556E